MRRIEVSVIAVIAAAAAVLLALVAVSTYNRLVRLRNATENAFGALDAQLKNRFDLVPNVVAAVGSYVKHERSLLEGLTALRAQALAPGATAARRVELAHEQRVRPVDAGRVGIVARQQLLHLFQQRLRLELGLDRNLLGEGDQEPASLDQAREDLAVRPLLHSPSFSCRFQSSTRALPPSASASAIWPAAW